MNKKYINNLEYPLVLKALSEFCVTDIGKKLCNNLEPKNTHEIVTKLLQETSEAMNLYSKKKSLPISQLPKIDYSIKLLESSGVLSIKSLLELASILKMADSLKNYFFKDDSINTKNFPILEEYFSLLYTNSGICDTIFSILLDENTICDKATPKLLSIRKEKRKLEESIKEKLNNFVHSSKFSKYIQENLITLRNERYVIPVKEEYRSIIKGFIHDISASGSTVFIEPTIIFELNNELNLKKSEEINEIESILANLSSLFYPYTKQLQNNITYITTIDFVFAKAKCATYMDCICPTLNKDKQIHLIGARHPFIPKDKMVPIDVHLGKDYNTLVITGPNTGGKTVTLKITGLLTLMACSGLFIPAKSSSSIYVFDEVYSDIGDEQSIIESLSTFSSHMTTIVDILKNSTSQSLILLDELGAGTDPIEGSSLAISILEEFYNKSSLTIATTHYSELKNYCIIKEGFENASCSFDLENLQPTYQLLIGVPGQSNAFNISRKLGLNEDILKRANTFIKKDYAEIEVLLKNIYDNKLTIENEKSQIQKNSKQIELLRKTLEKKQNQLQDKSNSIVENAKKQAREILLDAKKQASLLIQEINHISKNIDSSSLQKLNQMRNNINNSIKSNLSSSNAVENDSSYFVNEHDLKIGCIVYIPFLDKEGCILSLPNKTKEVLLQIGNMKMMVPISKIGEIKNPLKNETFTGSSSYNISKTKTANSEINVLGYNVEEAIFVIDKFLDDSILAKLQTVRIVHGKGTGALRNGIHKYLKTNSYVKSFRLGTYGEGEMGVTVVELK